MDWYLCRIDLPSRRTRRSAVGRPRIWWSLDRGEPRLADRREARAESIDSFQPLINSLTN